MGIIQYPYLLPLRLPTHVSKFSGVAPTAHRTILFFGYHRKNATAIVQKWHNDIVGFFILSFSCYFILEVATSTPWESSHHDCHYHQSPTKEFSISHDVSSDTLENWYRRTPEWMGVLKWYWLLPRQIFVLLRALSFTGKLTKKYNNQQYNHYQNHYLYPLSERVYGRVYCRQWQWWDSSRHGVRKYDSLCHCRACTFYSATRGFQHKKNFPSVIVEEVFINNMWYNLNKGNRSLDLKRNGTFTSIIRPLDAKLKSTSLVNSFKYHWQ